MATSLLPVPATVKLIVIDLIGPLSWYVEPTKLMLEMFHASSCCPVNCAPAGTAVSVGIAAVALAAPEQAVRPAQICVVVRATERSTVVSPSMKCLAPLL